jgi:hypothetical protein
MLLQRLLQAFAGVLFVINDQDAWHHAEMKPSALVPVNGK